MRISKWTILAALVAMFFGSLASAVTRPSTIDTTPGYKDPNDRVERTWGSLFYETDIDNSLGGASNLFYPTRPTDDGETVNYLSEGVFVRAIDADLWVKVLQYTGGYGAGASLDSTALFKLSADVTSPMREHYFRGCVYAVWVWKVEAGTASGLVNFD